MADYTKKITRDLLKGLTLKKQKQLLERIIQYYGLHLETYVNEEIRKLKKWPRKP